MANKAILCVDDEPMVLTALRDQIGHRFGDAYRYELAEGVDEAWETIEELDREGVEIAVIISDWLMPGIKGDEFLLEVYLRFPQIVNIMLTGHADKVAIERARRYANLHAYIPKPWERDTIIAAIESGLEKARQHPANEAAGISQRQNDE
ncbi:MAG: response regulator [Cyanosarcina radialis HA8281-LM2]|jgi:DNA-binding NtrC family response regulator|nr:response regulator [Cyanosarcina radialis HA8281-LM2]